MLTGKFIYIVLFRHFYILYSTVQYILVYDMELNRKLMRQIRKS